MGASKDFRMFHVKAKNIRLRFRIHAQRQVIIALPTILRFHLPLPILRSQLVHLHALYQKQSWNSTGNIKFGTSVIKIAIDPGVNAHFTHQRFNTTVITMFDLSLHDIKIRLQKH